MILRLRAHPVCAVACHVCSLVFSYEILTPAALNFFVSYAEGAVESLWSIDQYFQFVLVLMLSTGLSFQVRTGAVSVQPFRCQLPHVRTRNAQECPPQ